MPTAANTGCGSLRRSQRSNGDTVGCGRQRLSPTPREVTTRELIAVTYLLNNFDERRRLGTYGRTCHHHFQPACGSTLRERLAAREEELNGQPLHFSSAECRVSGLTSPSVVRYSGPVTLRGRFRAFRARRSPRRARNEGLGHSGRPRNRCLHTRRRQTQRYGEASVVVKCDELLSGLASLALNSSSSACVTASLSLSGVSATQRADWRAVV
jgi:hypothetical protein